MNAVALPRTAIEIPLSEQEAAITTVRGIHANGLRFIASDIELALLDNPCTAQHALVALIAKELAPSHPETTVIRYPTHTCWALHVSAMGRPLLITPCITERDVDAIWWEATYLDDKDTPTISEQLGSSPEMIHVLLDLLSE
ncbi:Uncharacterised protein [Dermatophilus congolensis]|uniref:Uncharacterized protein n=1 Tax=Dermatophilus congolensis TaxID=1863 RepID=A0AA46BLE6_9MICO|nr:hypothetical protein [Dermatophilus congolensis]STD03820.1 Uncharacterised protein [Dermatophilus congolensis]